LAKRRAGGGEYIKPVRLISCIVLRRHSRADILVVVLSRKVESALGSVVSGFISVLQPFMAEL
jgi:hypothetical protein